jgi:hypothetical protein
MVLPVTEESQGVMLEEMGRNDAPVKLSWEWGPRDTFILTLA